jgi:hypothetical protein
MVCSFALRPSAHLHTETICTIKGYSRARIGVNAFGVLAGREIHPQID